MGLIAIELEKNGIPTSALIYKEHEGNYMSAAALAGYGPAPTVAFNADEAQSVEGAKQIAKANVDAVVKGLLTSKPPYMKRDGKLLLPENETFTFKGKNTDEAMAAFNQFYLKMRWSDGLPLVAPTKEKVEWLLTGTDRNPDDVVGTMGPSLGRVTVRNIAVNAAMAGARPEYMPVIIAAMEAITSQPYNWYAAQLRGVAPLVVVNGPIVKDLGIAHRNNGTGPTPEAPAGATIGRTVNMVWRNAGGFGYGMTPPAQHGQPGMFTGLVVAESEWDTFSKWKPLNQQLGFPAGSNTVTVIGVVGTMNLPGSSLKHAAYAIPAVSAAWPGTEKAWKARKTGVLLVTPFMAGRLQGRDETAPSNMTKEDVQKFLYENATISRKEFVDLMAGGDESKATGLAKELLAKYAPGQEIPIGSGPESFIVLNSGGWCSCMPWEWMNVDQFMSAPVAKLVKLPKAWDTLVKAAK